MARRKTGELSYAARRGAKRLPPSLEVTWPRRNSAARTAAILGARFWPCLKVLAKA
jgi:hypothetical protein